MWVLIFSGAAVAAAGVNESALPEEKRTLDGFYLTAKEAYDLLQKDGIRTLFLDVRSRAEVATLGMPTLADANIPLLELTDDWNQDAGNFRMIPNPNFLAKVTARVQQKGLDQNARIVLICRSGNRSAKAADLLSKNGFKQVYSVVDGFEGDIASEGKDKGHRVVNGWKNSGLPWSYQLDKATLLLP